MFNKKAKRAAGQQLGKATAEKVFGWKNVHRYKDELIGKKQDKAGRWRKARVPDYVNDQRLAYAIDERMKQLGRLEQYLNSSLGSRKRRIFPSIGPHLSSGVGRHSKR